MLSLDNIKVKDSESGFMSKRPGISLFNTENRSLYSNNVTSVIKEHIIQ